MSDETKRTIYASVLCTCGQRHDFFQNLGMGYTKCTCGRTVLYRRGFMDYPNEGRPLPDDVLRMLAQSLVDSIRPTTELKAEFVPVELKCTFIEVDGWLIDLAKVWHAHIDSGHIMLSQLGGGVLIFENEETAAELVSGANQLNDVAFNALAEYLRRRFNAENVMTPVDKAFEGKDGTVPLPSDDSGEDSKK